MARIRTLTQLQDALDTEIGWRIREISAFKIAAKSSSSSQASFIRAGIALVYAHWEGFVKGASEHYLGYVDNQRLLYKDLKTCFAVFGLKGKLVQLADSRKAASNIAALDFVIEAMDKPARMAMSNAVDTESNLTSKVFANIATSLDISTTPYETKFNLIDESLVRRRNKVAHGEYLDLKIDDFLTLSDEMLQLMRSYKTDLENAASLETYKRLKVSPEQRTPI